MKKSDRISFSERTPKKACSKVLVRRRTLKTIQSLENTPTACCVSGAMMQMSPSCMAICCPAIQLVQVPSMTHTISRKSWTAGWRADSAGGGTVPRRTRYGRSCLPAEYPGKVWKGRPECPHGRRLLSGAALPPATRRRIVDVRQDIV